LKNSLTAWIPHTHQTNQLGDFCLDSFAFPKLTRHDLTGNKNDNELMLKFHRRIVLMGQVEKNHSRCTFNLIESLGRMSLPTRGLAIESGLGSGLMPNWRFGPTPLPQWCGSLAARPVTRSPFGPRSAALVPVMLGVLQAGCIFVPLNDDAPAERLQRMVMWLQPVVPTAESNRWSGRTSRDGSPQQLRYSVPLLAKNVRCGIVTDPHGFSN
jgi:hypothetical protein